MKLKILRNFGLMLIGKFSFLYYIFSKLALISKRKIFSKKIFITEIYKQNKLLIYFY